MHDEHQVHIPPSFIEIHSDARRRLQIPLDELRARYELCEDLASHLVGHCQGVHVEVGVDEQDVLRRCHQGLCAPEAGLARAEAGWVVTRLAELLGWPWPDWGAAPP